MKNLVLVEIADDPIKPAGQYTDNGITKQTKAKQTAYLHTGERYPGKFQLNVDDRDGPLRPGMYLLGGTCFRSGQFGPEITWSKVDLVPVADAITLLQKQPNKIAAVG